MQQVVENFWTRFEEPIFCLAPMEDVTDTVFREVVMKMTDPGKLHVIFTEFTSVEGLNHPVGRERVGERLIVNESERELLRKLNIKLVAQIWGKTPEIYRDMAQFITEHYDFDGLDINMGCPVKKIVKQGACSALIDQPDLAKEIVLATKEGTHLPVSVKTRTGIRQHETERWIDQLLDTHPAALTLHGRTQKQQSDGEADWNEIAKAVQVRNERGIDIPVLGNGDVFSWKEGMDRVAQTGADGVMIGRGIFHDPWFFQPGRTVPTPAERANMLLYHTRLFEKTWSGKKNFNILKRFYKIYLNQFTNAAHIRAALMETKNYDEVYHYFEQHPVAESL